MASAGDFAAGANWLTKNRGFLSLVIGFGSVIVSIVCATWFTSSRIHAFDTRILLGEQRLEQLEVISEELRRDVRAIGNEQLRRTSPVSKIEALHDSVRRLEDKLSGPGG